MPRSRPASNPISYHRYTNQYYVTRGGRRTYLGSDKDQALKKYHQLGLGLKLVQAEPVPPIDITVKELANRFILAQQANWRNPNQTLKCYRHWLGRFLRDHPKLKASEFTVEMFAAWKLSLRHQKYAPESINHYLSAVRAIFNFASQTGIVQSIPNLKRIRNEPCPKVGSKEKPLYSPEDIRRLLNTADLQMKTMILLGLNCGFGPKDIRDLTWDDIEKKRITLPRSKTGVCQTYVLWPETLQLLVEIRYERARLVVRRGKRETLQSDDGHVFITRYWRCWSKDAVGEQFRKLCKKAGIPCYGFYRLRHCASTAMSLVATPHVHRKFMRHSQLQQQVTYTHTPDSEVDSAIMRAKEKLLGKKNLIHSQGKNQGHEGVA